MSLFVNIVHIKINIDLNCILIQVNKSQIYKFIFPTTSYNQRTIQNLVCCVLMSLPKSVSVSLKVNEDSHTLRKENFFITIFINKKTIRKCK